MDQQIISKIIETQTFPVAIERGLSIEHFRSNTSKFWFGILEKYYRKYSTTPTFERFIQLCDNFQRLDSQETLEELIDQLVHSNTETKVIAEIERLTNYLKSNKPDIGEEFYASARRVLGSTQEEGVSDLSEMWLDIATYKDELKNPSRWKLSYGLNGSLKTLDYYTGGVQLGEFIVVAGRLTVGKSNFTRRLVGNFFWQGVNILVVTVEETREVYRHRMNSMLSGISYNALKEKKLSNIEMQAYENTAQHIAQAANKIRIIGGLGSATIPRIVAAIERYKPDIVVVDGAYMLRLNNTTPLDLSWTNMAAVYDELRRISLGYNLPVIAVHQLNREADDDNPSIINLSYADFIGQVASVGVVLTHPQSFVKNKRRLEIIKNRDGDTPPTGSIILDVDFDRMTVMEV